jgi:hypothetical protein
MFFLLLMVRDSPGGPREMLDHIFRRAPPGMYCVVLTPKLYQISEKMARKSAE